MNEAIKSDRSQRQRNRAIWHSLRGNLAKNLEEGHQYELQTKFLAKVGATEKENLLKMYGYQSRALTLAALWGMPITIPQEFLEKYKNDKQNDVRGHQRGFYIHMLRFCDAIGFPEDELFDLWPFSLASTNTMRMECIRSGFPAIQGMLVGNQATTLGPC